jgi:hypothetical protein
MPLPSRKIQNESLALGLKAKKARIEGQRDTPVPTFLFLSLQPR